MPRWRVDLGAPARDDIDVILQATSDHFGERQRAIYSATLELALAALTDGPNVLGSVARDNIRPNFRTLHVARMGRRGRHLILYRAGAGDVIEVLRILHDAMDIARHVPPGPVDYATACGPAISPKRRRLPSGSTTWNSRMPDGFVWGAINRPPSDASLKARNNSSRCETYR